MQANRQTQTETGSLHACTHRQTSDWAHASNSTVAQHADGSTTCITRAATTSKNHKEANKSSPSWAGYLGSHAHVSEEALMGGPEGSPQQAAPLLGQASIPLSILGLLSGIQELPPQLVPHAGCSTILLTHLSFQGSFHHLKLGACKCS